MDATPPIPEHLPGEPVRRPLSGPRLGLELVRRLLVLLLSAALCLPLWAIYLPLRLFLPRPPVIPSPARARRLLGALVTAPVPAPGLSPGARAALILETLRRLAVAPVFGLGWMADPILYGRRLRAIRVEAPLFELSASRSGSTQLARYVEEDPRVVAPSALQFGFPYLWLWRLAAGPLGGLVSRAWVERTLAASFPPEWLERHELDPFRTDTFEVPVLMRYQWSDLFCTLGPDAMRDELWPGRLPETPGARAVWEEDFLDFLDGIARKTLLFAAPGPDGSPRRLMIKGHFLAVAEALERRYPDGRFLTVLREPEKRLQSVINFHRCHGTDAAFGPYPWAWVVARALEAEPDYDETERLFFCREARSSRTAVRFDAYVRDLEGTLRAVYRDWLDLPPPAALPSVHAERRRTQYRVDRSLEQLGVDLEALRRRMEPYERWRRSLPAPAGR